MIDLTTEVGVSVLLFPLIYQSKEEQTLKTQRSSAYGYGYGPAGSQGISLDLYAVFCIIHRVRKSMSKRNCPPILSTN